MNIEKAVNRINAGIDRLQQASSSNLRTYHQSIVDMDHILLSDFIDGEDAEKIVAQASRSGLLARSQELYRPYETLLEESFARMILATSEVDFLGDANITHNYLMRYYNLAANEIKLARMQKDDHVLFIGSGPFPITAIEYARQTGCKVDCVEMLSDKADVSRNVINRLEMSDQVQVHTAEGQAFSPRPYSVVLIGVLAQPKQDIINNLEINGRDKIRVLTRTTTDLRQFIYPAAEFQTTRYTYQGMHRARRDQALSTILLK